MLLASACLFSALASWSLVERSAIPMEVDGTVTEVEVRPEKHPGVDDVWFVWINGASHHLDAEVASRLEVGDTVVKERWTRHVVVDGSERLLDLSDDARMMSYLSPVIVLLCAALALPSGNGSTTTRSTVSGLRRPRSRTLPTNRTPSSL